MSINKSKQNAIITQNSKWTKASVCSQNKLLQTFHSLMVRLQHTTLVLISSGFGGRETLRMNCFLHPSVIIVFYSLQVKLKRKLLMENTRMSHCFQPFLPAFRNWCQSRPNYEDLLLNSIFFYLLREQSLHLLEWMLDETMHYSGNDV